MDRTLYLSESGSDVRVRRDGPSVWVTRQNSAGQRIPARLVSRVVIIGNVMLDAGSITLFSENDIPVVFMARNAEEVAVAMPYSHRLPLYYRAQKGFLSSNADVQAYRVWAETWHRAVQSSVLKRLYPQLGHTLPFRIGEKDYQDVIAYLKPHDEAKWDVVRGFVNNLFRTVIVEQLIRRELDPNLGVIHREYALGLVLDICHMVEAERDLQCLQFFRTSVDKPAAERSYRVCNVTDSVVRNLMHRFENRRGAITKMIADIIAELVKLMGRIQK